MRPYPAEFDLPVAGERQRDPGGPRHRRRTARGPAATGEADLCADTGIDPGDPGGLLAIRTQVVLASAAAGIDPPIGPVSTDFRDLDALAESTKNLARLGFRGRSCIHPAQVPIVNEVFTPDPVALTRARELLSRFESAHGGVVLDADGRMVDLAVIRRARRLLADAGAER